MPKCRSFRSEMLQYEADLKMRRHWLALVWHSWNAYRRINILQKRKLLRVGVFVTWLLKLEVRNVEEQIVFRIPKTQWRWLRRSLCFLWSSFLIIKCLHCHQCNNAIWSVNYLPTSTPVHLIHRSPVVVVTFVFSLPRGSRRCIPIVRRSICRRQRPLTCILSYLAFQAIQRNTRNKDARTWLK